MNTEIEIKFIKPKRRRVAGHLSGRHTANRKGFLDTVIKTTGWTINRIADSTNMVTIIKDSELLSPKIFKQHISSVIQGKRNTKKYIEVIEKVWLLPIEKIRELYKSDIERKPTITERQEFAEYYRDILQDAKSNGRYISPFQLLNK